MFGRKRKVGGEKSLTDVSPIGCRGCGIVDAESPFGTWRQIQRLTRDGVTGDALTVAGARRDSLGGRRCRRPRKQGG